MQDLFEKYFVILTSIYSHGKVEEKWITIKSSYFKMKGKIGYYRNANIHI